MIKYASWIGLLLAATANNFFAQRQSENGLLSARRSFADMRNTFSTLLLGCVLVCIA
jgi:hypothetical protein